MAGLPTPGGNANNWGTMLNEYLQQSLAADGTLVSGPTNAFTGEANANLASGSKAGLVRLAGDLSNTAASPKVVGLQGNAVNSAAPSDGNVLTWDNASGQWKPRAPAIVGGAYISNLDGGDAYSVYGAAIAIDGGTA